MAAAVLNRVAGACHGELQGTYLLVLFGTGAVLPESGPLRNRAGRGRADLAARAPLVEALGTASPVLVIFGRSDPDNAAAPEPRLAPFFVGFTVAVLSACSPR